MNDVPVIIIGNEEPGNCNAATLFPGAPIYVPAVLQDEYKAAKLGKRVAPLDCDGGQDCVLLNMAVASATRVTKARHIALCHAWTGNLMACGEGYEGIDLPLNRINTMISSVAQIMRLTGAEIGGFSFAPEWVNQHHLIYPYSTVQAICPGLVVIDTRAFRTFIDLPYFSAVYEYQMRALAGARTIIRANRYATDCRPEFISTESLQEIYGVKRVKEVWHGKTQSRYMKFKTEIDGV